MLINCRFNTKSLSIFPEINTFAFENCGKSHLFQQILWCEIELTWLMLNGIKQGGQLRFRIVIHHFHQIQGDNKRIFKIITT